MRFPVDSGGLLGRARRWFGRLQARRGAHPSRPDLASDQSLNDNDGGQRWLRAVDDVSLRIYRGETVGLVGESGCGKSTLGRAILQLYKPSAGAVYFDGRDLCQMSPADLHKQRRRFQMIFQDPYASLNPRMTVEEILSEPMQVHHLAHGQTLRVRVQSLMNTVGLDPRYVRRYPHEFSGGQRQRIGIARALACQPDFIVCDEPISALDVSIQAQILNLLQSLQRELGLTYLFIAHDLAAVRHIADRIAVMYLGKVVEIAPSNVLLQSPVHPYTRALISAVPIPDPDAERTRERIVLQGDVPSPLDPPRGCRFHTRCPYAWDRCRKAPAPPLHHVGPDHFVACHLVEEPERLTPHSGALPLPPLTQGA